jgi:hypothetical protein
MQSAPLVLIIGLGVFMAVDAGRVRVLDSVCVG